MMTITRNMLELVVNPFFLCVVLLGGMIVCLKRAVYVRITLCLVFIVFMLLSTGWVPQYLTYRLESKYPVINQPDPAITWVVVLSGGQSQHAKMPPNALLSSASIKRLIEGVRLFRHLPNAKLLLSGGGYRYEQSEAQNLSYLVAWFDVPKNKVVLEMQSMNTADQAKAIQSIVHDQPFYLVTSAAHMPRAMQLCHQEGLRPIAAPTDFTFFWDDERFAKKIIPNAYNMMYFNVALHEILGQFWGKWTQTPKAMPFEAVH